jgi:hypothetical protein
MSRHCRTCGQVITDCYCLGDDDLAEPAAEPDCADTDTDMGAA